MECNEAGRTAARRRDQEHHQHLHGDAQADDTGDRWSGMAERAHLAMFGMAVDAMMVHQQRREQDHDCDAQDHREDANCERFAVSREHMVWLAAEAVTDI